MKRRRKIMRVLVTRPLEDAEETARQLALHGHEALIAPLLATHFWDGPEVILDGVQAILATSANGVRALARRTPRRDVALFAVGPQTAAEAQSSGFQTVKNADGDAAALAQCTLRWAHADQGALLHVAGEGNDGKLAGALAGFTLRQEILYAVTAAEKMPARAAMALQQGALDAALFFSPRSAAVFRDCARAEILSVNTMLAACISPAAAAALAPLRFRQVSVAVRPNLSALLELLDLPV
jgi:uroporphyrinogen-III synthase